MRGMGQSGWSCFPLGRFPPAKNLCLLSTAMMTWQRFCPGTDSLPIVQLTALVTFIYNIKPHSLSPNILHTMLCLFTSTLYADELEQPRPKSMKMPSESESIDSKIWSTMFSGLEEGTGSKEVSLSSSKDLCGSPMEWKSPFCCSAALSLLEHCTDTALGLSWSPGRELFMVVMELLEPLSMMVVRLE